MVYAQSWQGLCREQRCPSTGHDPPHETDELRAGRLALAARLSVEQFETPSPVQMTRSI
jgi:hypothetical protein